MRPMLIALAAAVLIAAPAAAQQRPSEKIQDYAPAIDRTADALLNLDLGPILDAADPYGRHHHRRTLRDMARRDDPDFERRMHATIYGTAATMGRAADAFAAAQPAMRRALSQFERDMAAAMAAPPPPRGGRPQDAPPPPAHGDEDPWGD